jgi:hypothetical protein
MFENDYNKIIREYFDLSDRYTRQYIVSLEDAGREQLLNALSSALYDKIIVDKVEDIDFGSIPLSRGDITKVEGFDGTEQCINIIRQLVLEYRQNTAIVDVVATAISNIKERKGLFIKAYSLNVELPMLIYNLVVLSIERATSLLIATCIEYVKDPTAPSMKAALNKAAYSKSMDDIMFKQLISFNNMCAKGQLDKILEEAMKHPVKEEVELQYGTVTPIDEIDPTGEHDDTNIPINNSPEAPGNDVDDNLFGDPQSPPDSNTPPVYADDECGGNCADVAVGEEEDEEDVDALLSRLDSDGADEPFDNSDEYERPELAPPPVDDIPEEELPVRGAPATNDNATVEPNNIPIVNPTDDIYSSDTPINEKPIKEIGGIAAALATAGAIAAGGIGLYKYGGLIINTVIGFIRSGVYYYYYTRVKLSDCLAVQADLIEANANELKYSDTDLSDKDRDKAVKKQLKTVNKLRKWANIFAIDSKTTSNRVNKEVENDKKKKHTVGKDDYNDDVLF